MNYNGGIVGVTTTHAGTVIIMINNPRSVGGSGMTQCTRCGSRMNYNDETTKLTEYACPSCHNTEIIQKESFRITA